MLSLFDYRKLLADSGDIVRCGGHWTTCWRQMKFTAGTSWFPGCPAPRKNIQAICKYASSRLALISNTDHYITSGQICCPGMLITKIGLLWSRCGSLKEKRHLQSFMHCLPQGMSEFMLAHCIDGIFSTGFFFIWRTAAAHVASCLCLTNLCKTKSLWRSDQLFIF